MTTPESDFKFSQSMALKVPEEVQVLMIPHKRWDALKSQVRDLGERSSSFSSAAWGFVGIAVTAIASLLSWAPAFAAMSVDLRNEFNWVWVVLFVALAVGFCVSVALFLANRTIQSGRTASVESVLTEMDLLADA